MAKTLGLEKAGPRLYVTGDCYAIRDRLKAAGCHWDPDRRQWWVGAAKAAAVEAVLAAASLGDRPASGAAIEFAGGTPEMAAAALDAESSHTGPGAPVRPREDPGSIRLTGRGEYKGRTYYVGAYTRDGKRCRLLTLPDAKGDFLDFWAEASQVRVVKSYPPRETSSGYGRYRRTEHTTLGSVAAFVHRQQDPATRRGACTECGAYGPSGQPCRECGGEGSHA